jgi:hypothetical protein
MSRRRWAMAGQVHRRMTLILRHNFCGGTVFYCFVIAHRANGQRERGWMALHNTRYKFNRWLPVVK